MKLSIKTIIHDFKVKTLELCKIIHSKTKLPTYYFPENKKKYIGYDNVLSELDVYIFQLNLNEAIGINSMINFLEDGDLVNIIKNKDGRKVYIEILGPVTTFLDHANKKIEKKSVPDNYIMDISSITKYEDRTGLYDFTEEHNIILNNLKYLQWRLNSPSKIIDKAKTMAFVIKETMFALIKFKDIKRDEFLDYYVQKRYGINKDHILRNFIMSIFHKSNEYDYSDNPKGFICYGIKTLNNIFTTTDIKRFGFNQDLTEIKTILAKNEELWRHQLSTL